MESRKMGMSAVSPRKIPQVPQVARMGWSIIDGFIRQGKNIWLAGIELPIHAFDDEVSWVGSHHSFKGPNEVTSSVSFPKGSGWVVVIIEPNLFRPNEKVIGIGVDGRYLHRLDHDRLLAVFHSESS